MSRDTNNNVKSRKLKNFPQAIRIPGSNLHEAIFFFLIKKNLIPKKLKLKYLTKATNLICWGGGKL